MAEALAPVPDAVLTALRPGPWTTPARAVRALARELLPDEAADPAPSWLLPDQVPSFRRVLAAVRRFGGALLADPLGSGKTYVSLAAAAALAGRHPVVCFVPASLVPQWRGTAERLEIAHFVVSHEQVSRGRLPGVGRCAAIVDECHRFRHPRIRRYRHLAPWLIGRPTVLVSATPVVNRLEDLLHQLLLAMRDDALLPDGIPSLRVLLRSGTGAPSLGRLVVERLQAASGPRRSDRVSPPAPGESARASDALDLLDSLALSRSPPIAALLRSVLRRAASSSPAALNAALRRYRGLLLHARDAVLAGCPMDRAAIRRFVGAAGDQLLLWELLPAAEAGGELALDDLERLEGAIEQSARWCAEPDPKVERLAGLLDEGTPTLVFISSPATIRYLRDRLGARGLAWCTGERAGLGPTAMPRDTVLGWFREGVAGTYGERAGARHLLVTDVAAEGLDLQRAARVVHYDLPWTPMRLDQRDGRAIRLGSRHPLVEVVRFPPPAPLERALRIEALLRRKRALPATAGLGAPGRRLWRWRTELAERLARGECEAGVAIVPRGPAGILAGFALQAVTAAGTDLRLAFALGWLDEQGRWTEDEDTVASRMSDAISCAAACPADAPLLRSALVRLAPAVRHRLATVRERRWAARGCEGPARTVAAGLQTAIREAARRRDGSALRALDRAMAFVAGGHTAGEAMLLERLAGQAPEALARGAARWPTATPRWDAVAPRLASVLIFVPGG